MGMVVRSNIMAMNANRQLGVNNSAVSKNLEKLSSGFKINRAGDDASGLAISEKMKAQIKGLETASANSQDGISLVQTAEGALTEVHDMLNRMVELATKSANGTIKDDVDREAIQKEVDALNAEIDRISQSTNFNGINLLDGSLSAGGASGTGGAGDPTLTGTVPALGNINNVANFGTGSASATLDLSSMSLDGPGTLTFKIGGKSYDVTFDAAADGTKIADEVAKAYNNDKISEGAASLGAYTATASAGVITFATGSDTATGANSDVATDLANISLEVKTSGGAEAPKTASFKPTAADTLTDAGIASIDLSKAGEVSGKVSVAFTKATNTFSLKIGSDTFELTGTAPTNSGTVTLTKTGGAETIELTLGANATTKFGGDVAETELGNASLDGGGLTLQIGDTNDPFNKVTVSVEDMSATGLGTNGLDVGNQTSAGDAIKTIKDAINKVSTNRATLGALQNRLEHTINNLDVAAENMSAANSRVRDTDMAKQMMEYTKMNVLTQAAQAMLAQANQQPQSILQLLQ